REFARAQRNDEPLCLALLDLDSFKAFNDTHGHPAGDAVLRDAAQQWKRLLRLSDVLARYGGEEFGLVFPAWPIDHALAVVERLRAATPGGVTASAGLAVWRSGESQEQLIARADGALYEAKRGGRDQTVTAPETAPGALVRGRRVPQVLSASRARSLQNGSANRSANSRVETAGIEPASAIA
ncbi:MAG TPA: GGDEF domain-containing protein, partial [Solirubrobacteraceae bacterium]|nr:GGDEF domain-containing protein [Solirubrobacteraceae bacterium]